MQIMIFYLDFHLIDYILFSYEHWAFPERNCAPSVEDINFFEVDPLQHPLDLQSILS